MAKQVIADGETGLSVRTKVNSNFTEVYGISEEALDLIQDLIPTLGSLATLSAVAGSGITLSVTGGDITISLGQPTTFRAQRSSGRPVISVTRTNTPTTGERPAFSLESSDRYDELTHDASGLILRHDVSGATPKDAKWDGSDFTINGVALTTAENVRDIIASALVAGDNVTIAHDDAANTITVSSTGGGGGVDAEFVRDTIGSALVAGEGISLTVNDPSNTIQINNTRAVLYEPTEDNQPVSFTGGKIISGSVFDIGDIGGGSAGKVGIVNFANPFKNSFYKVVATLRLPSVGNGFCNIFITEKNAGYFRWVIQEWGGVSQASDLGFDWIVIGEDDTP